MPSTRGCWPHGASAASISRPPRSGPAVVPPVNLGEHGDAREINLITCGAQATIPVVAALSRVADVTYAETVSTISSRSAGPGTRQNIDEFTTATAGGLETIGGAREAKAIIILNPADPPIMMRNTIYAEIADPDAAAIEAAVAAAVADVAAYVPGYRLLMPPLIADGVVTVMVEVEGAGDNLPAYAGNLDIMTAAAVRVAELHAGAPAMTDLRVVDTTLRDGSHAIRHQYTVEQVRTIASALDRAGVWAIAVGHGDGLGASSIQYGRPLHSDAELLAAAASVIERAQIAVAILPGIGTRRDLEMAREAGASVARVSTVCTEADIGVQHLRLARELGMTAHTHLNTAHLLDPPGLVEQAKVVAAAGSTGVFIVDSAGAFLTDDVRRRVVALRQALPAEVAVGIHEHNNLSLAVANSAAAIAEGATLVDTSLAGLGAGAGNCQTEVLVAVLERMGIQTGIDLWALQDIADQVVRGEVMQRPIEIDRLTATMGYAAVPASYLLHAIRAGERFGIDPRDLIVELGRRRVVVGQEDAIIGIAASMAPPGGRP